jgi:pseudouridine synthase
MERIQKILARAGIASRRKAEDLITSGEVTVNGKVAKLGDKAEFGKDAIKVRGKLLLAQETSVYLALYKPVGVISMLADPEGRATLKDLLHGVRERVFPIGRLDFNSEGLILLTNDGDFAEKLQRRDDVPRVYHVKVKGHPTEEMLQRLRRGLKVGRRMIKPHLVRMAEDLASKARVEVVLLGSGAVDLKAYFEAKGFLVERIRRVAIGHISVDGIAPGQHRLLRESQVLALLNQPELGMRRLDSHAPVAAGKPRPVSEKQEVWPPPRGERKPDPDAGVKITPRTDRRPERRPEPRSDRRPEARPEPRREGRPTFRPRRPARGAH